MNNYCDFFLHYFIVASEGLENMEEREREKIGNIILYARPEHLLWMTRRRCRKQNWTVYIYENVLTLRWLCSGSSREGSLGPRLTWRERHLDGSHVLNISPGEIASLFRALVVPKKPAEVLGLFYAALPIVLHGQQRRLADGQQVSRLQIQVLLLVLGECIEGTVLETFRRHFVRETNSKWPQNRGLDGAARVPPQPQGSALQKSSTETRKVAESLNCGDSVISVACGGFGGEGGGRGSHP